MPALTVACYYPRGKTGVRDYAEALCVALNRHGVRATYGNHADICLYHLGNNPLHRDIYLRALARPGVVVLHDAVLHHFFLGWLDEPRYVEEFVYNYGEWSRELACRLWQRRAHAAADARYFQFAMLRRIAERSKAVVVHNPAAARLVQTHAPQASVFEIPHMVLPAAWPSPAEAERLRQDLGIPPQSFVFGLFGYLRASKRPGAVLRAFARLRATGIGCALLIAGDFVSPELERSLAPLLAQPGVIRVRHSPERRFLRLMMAADACINLRWPSAGETSGITIRMMDAGKPVLVTASEENCRFPEDACVRIEGGILEEEMLFASMLWLARSRETARRIGRVAQAYVRRVHASAPVAAAYCRLLRQIAA
jgi:glycosyltransferase involved in cell wall biosynthesis